MKMQAKLLLSAMLCTTLVACGTTNKTSEVDNSRRDLVMKMCTIDEQACACMADQMVSSLTDKEWTVFTALVNQAEQPPEGTTQEDLTKLSDKLQNIDQTCGVQP